MSDPDDDRPEHLPTEVLDAVRGAAATYVMLFHARGYLFISAATVFALGLHGPLRLAIVAGALVRYGHVAVLAFFLVSGYAIHYRQAFRIADGSRPVIAWPAYAVHRLRRIYPPLCAALLLTFLLDLLMARLNPAADLGDTGLNGFIGALFFVQGFAAPVLTTNQPLWSLTYEGFFYVGYPLMLAVNRTLGPRRCLLLFVALGLACALANGAGAQVGILWPLAYWPAWVAGAFVADVRAGRLAVPDTWWNGAALGGVLLLIVVALTIGSGQAGGVNQFDRISNADIFWVIGLFGPIGWMAAGRHSRRQRARVLRLVAPFFGLGAISYSLYLVHFPVVMLLHVAWLAHHAGLPTSPWLLLTGIVCALTAAVMVYTVAERPFLSRRNLARQQRELSAKGSTDLATL